MPARTACRPLALVVALAAGAVLLAGCGSGDGGAAADGKLRVEASFYPLQWMAEEVGGDLVSVANLTKPGAEPHDLELSPKDVAALSDADVVVYLSGFQPAVDDALAESGATTFDAKASARLDLTLAEEANHAGGDGADEGHDDEAGAVDPHFWLDPTRLAKVATAFADVLAKQDPDHAATFRSNAARLVGRLDDLDGEYRQALEGCSAKELVTSHQAFGYLAERYGMDQVGIAGLTPEQEPSAAQLASAPDFVAEHRVRTIYFETLVSPDVAETVASEAGVKTAVLDPIEGLTDASQGRDYLEVMRSNLKHLQAGQPCP
ncbi:zinc ABC transporter substrate-binding protein [Aquihabitans sp. G128]|uniref:metal ABC transporter solute-binding protein, Zn/Mn family n=1 Tax=Aquihabitans sp. G128 TaxID=2849779 RepID=UPI001C21811A|nr:zinc ABC transporter substrate-binding protein [Aquihabitans sp. G128]QXC59448.1 zinc ABC transporter substrate-binding protein [Aquihabitans sp. G128]